MPAFDGLLRSLSRGLTRVRSRRRGAAFVFDADQSFWCTRSERSWVHGVWQVRGLPPHVVIEEIYLRRRVVRRRREFPFVRLHQRTKATAYGRSGRLRGSGRIEADFVLPVRVPQGRRLVVTITFVDQVNRRYRARCAFEWRGVQNTVRASVSSVAAL